MSKKNLVGIPEEVLTSKIYLIRGLKVMFDKDLAELYGVQTRRLKEQVRRNMDRFPVDFMFEMTKDELNDWRSQFATSKSELMGIRRPPFVFTEHGIMMLSSVLNSSRAIKVNIQIMRIFIKLKEILLTHKELLLKMDEIEIKVSGQDAKIKLIFDYLKQFIHQQNTPRKQIGFKTDNK